MAIPRRNRSFENDLDRERMVSTGEVYIAISKGMRADRARCDR
jgi:hypothetical protein